AGDENCAEPLEGGPAAVPVDIGEEGMAGAAGAVGGERAFIRGRGQLACRELCPSAAVAERVEERAVRILCPVGEVTREPVEHDRRSAVDDGERVAPQPERQPE